MKRRPACFLDRDGTLVLDRQYAATAEAMELAPGAIPAVRLLNRASLAAVVVTNQSGIGRGLFGLDVVEAQHERMSELMMAGGAVLDAFYVCPHRPDAGCDCRKPGTALLERAADELALDLSRSWMVGDKTADVECGQRGAAGGLRVVTARETAAEEMWQRERSPGGGDCAPFADVLAAVRHLLDGPWRDLSAPGGT